ncbi:MAG TPA: hypothetical protein DIC19_05890 [Erysipelotrichaceae bacterium]|nr:hypothetical protein [Erysipelotrichaceae bacterium]
MKYLKIIFIVLLLSACSKTDIVYQIDDKHTVTYTIEAFIDLEPLSTDLKTTLIDLVEKVDQDYQARGFETHTEVSETSILLNYTQTKTNPNLETAYLTLQSMMSDYSNSLFLSVDLTTEVQKTLGAFNLTATSDLNTFLQATNLKQLPPTLEEEITSHLKQGTITIDIILPKAEILSVNKDVEIIQGDDTTTLRANLTLDKALELDVQGTHVIQNGKVIERDIQSSLEKSKNDIALFENLRLIALLITGLSLIAFIIRSLLRKA